jgi:phosphoribosylformylglycinamidine (FGAM) synthase-like enzyme
VALAEMAMAGGIGAALPEVPQGVPTHAYLFGEDQARYLLAVEPQALPSLLAAAEAAGVPAREVGRSGGDALIIPGELPISLGELRAAQEGWLPAYMAGEMS